MLGEEKGFSQFQLIPYDNLSTSKQLGEGSFGIVYRGKWGRAEVAIKQLKARPGSDEEFKRETAAWGRLNHPRIVRLFGITLNPYCMVMHYHPEGSLKNLLTNQKEALDWDADWRIRQQLAEDTANALDYLHREKRMIHRDIKVDNILVASESGVLRAYLSDFGLSQTHASSSSAFELPGGVAGTLIWMAPELFQGKSCSKQTDIYAYGLILWALATLNVHPFRDAPRIVRENFAHFGGWLQAADFSRSLQTPEHTPVLIQQLLAACLDKNYAKRPAIEKIVQELTGELTTVRMLLSAGSYELSMGSATALPVSSVASTGIAYELSMGSATQIPAKETTPRSPLTDPLSASLESKSWSSPMSSLAGSRSNERSKQVAWAAVEVVKQAKIVEAQQKQMKAKLTQLLVGSKYFDAIVALRKEAVNRQAWVKVLAESVALYQEELLEDDSCDEVQDAIAAWFKGYGVKESGTAPQSNLPGNSASHSLTTAGSVLLPKLSEAAKALEGLRLAADERRLVEEKRRLEAEQLEAEVRELEERERLRGLGAKRSALLKQQQEEEGQAHAEQASQEQIRPATLQRQKNQEEVQKKAIDVALKFETAEKAKTEHERIKAKEEAVEKAKAEQERIRRSWQSVLDPRTNKIFYRNSVTNEQVWSTPENYALEGVALRIKQEGDQRAAYEMERQRKELIKRSQQALEEQQAAERQRLLPLQDALVIACERGDAAEAKILIGKGAKPNLRGTKGIQPLGAAVWGMNSEAVDLLSEEMKELAPMTWDECEKHNLRCYEEVFMFSAFTPKTYQEWYDLLLKMDHSFLREDHFAKARKVPYGYSSWETFKSWVKNGGARTGVPGGWMGWTFRKGDIETSLCEATSNYHSSLRETIKRRIEHNIPVKLTSFK